MTKVIDRPLWQNCITNILYDIKIRTIFTKKKRQGRKYTWNYALVPLLYNKISVEVRVLPKSHFRRSILIMIL